MLTRTLDVPTAFDSRSDYAAFSAAGIPVGGLFTGAEVLKTPEEVALFGGKAGVACKFIPVPIPYVMPDHPRRVSSRFQSWVPLLISWVDDVNYHGVGDTIKNLNVGAWLQNTKAVAHSVATYAVSFASLGIGKREEIIAKREAWKQEFDTRTLESSSFAPHNVGTRNSPVVDPPVPI